MLRKSLSASFYLYLPPPLGCHGPIQNTDWADLFFLDDRYSITSVLRSGDIVDGYGLGLAAKARQSFLLRPSNSFLHRVKRLELAIFWAVASGDY
jgi:hypothetical protein